MAERRRSEPPLTADRLLWLVAALVFVAAPHAARVPLWVSVAFPLMALWRLAAHTGHVRLPGAFTKTLLALALLAGTYTSYGTMLGRDAGVALLVALTGMKLVETKSLRDAALGVLLSYFLAITNFFYSQSVLMGFHTLLSVILTTSVLIGQQVDAGCMAPRERLRVSLALVAQSLPIMLVLFVAFPRIPGPLWGLPRDAHAGLSGLSDRMSPGNISRLWLSDDVAFRVAFEGEPPPPAQRYWRGPVLWYTDGRTWTRGSGEPGARPVHAMGPLLSYTVTLEPHGKRWMFVLDAPVGVPERGRYTSDHQLVSRRPITSRIRYQMTSVTDYRLPEVTREDLVRATQLPVGAHPRARALAQSWLAETPDAERLVGLALAHFREQPFYYSLNVPVLKGDTVDAFLFESRRGFCEHYAAAFAVLMRAAGVPARVVTGYQGGELNPIDGYLIVRQRDAHAWVELWLGDRGWVRVDPTAAVSPQRVEAGVDTVLPPPVNPLIQIGIGNSTALNQLWLSLRFGWDALNNRWNQWVVSYGPERQRRLLSRVGVDPGSWRSMAPGLLALVGVPLLLVAGWLLRGYRPKADPVQAAWNRFCRKLARRGIHRHPHEGPRRFVHRAGRLLPTKATDIQRIGALYQELRYGRGRGDTQGLQRLVSTFRT